MPVEIREVIIRTEIQNEKNQLNGGMDDDSVNRLRKEILNQVRKMIQKEQKKRSNRI